MAALTEANYVKINNSNKGNNNSTCPPVQDPLPAGYIAYARARVEARNEERRAAGLGSIGGVCGDRPKHCVCSGMGCANLWKEWVAMGCPNGASAAAAGVNNENFGLAENVENNNSNVSSIHSNNSWNTIAYKQSKQMEKEGKKRRNTRRRRANRRTRSRR